MSLFKRVLPTTALLAAIVVTTGCGVVYSRQYYGSPGIQTVSASESSLVDVIANLGQPNAIFETGENQILIYRYAEGLNILGLYSNLKRQDTVVIVDAQGRVQWVAQVDLGMGETFISPPWMDATHPLRTDTLLFDAQNYESVTTREK